MYNRLGFQNPPPALCLGTSLCLKGGVVRGDAIYFGNTAYFLKGFELGKYRRCCLSETEN